MTESTSGPIHAPVSERDRMVIYLAILMALFLAALDQTIVATALPRIVEDLRGVDRYAWVATAYLLASTALALVYGKLADTYPRKSVTLGAVDEPAPSLDVDILALEEALEQLAGLHERKARVVELRWFGGLTIEQAAEALGVSTTTVEDDWAFARAWLGNRLEHA